MERLVPGLKLKQDELIELGVAHATIIVPVPTFPPAVSKRTARTSQGVRQAAA
jgi:hypothetical protein